ncbi:hypothetical protein JIN78_03785 [Roseibacillus ishigakijimensis]|uniref:Uncharacterized protein n=1 Tax=Roseibacillus ishigakijimensis TaxID=454146 RepID=A0A934RP05_9BACT|nr:hypothetical protein [Roseibacillus ishigakijimensis]
MLLGLGALWTLSRRRRS